jgi:hypothetical protein
MEHFELYIRPDKAGWKVTSKEGADGPYASFEEALDIAKQAALVLNAAGHTTRINAPSRQPVALES